MNIFPMNGSILPPNNKLVLVDTNVIIRLLGYDDNRKVNTEELKNFITTLAVNENILVYSIKTVEEVSQVISGQRLKKIKNNFPAKTQYKDIISNTPDFYNQIDNEVSKLWDYINKMPHFYETPIGIIDNNVLTQAKINSTKHNLGIADSIIYTQMKLENIQHIVTCDKDFITINDPDISLYLDSDNYLKHIKR
jgi:predicted nucleic acid-binding protein